MKAEDFLCMGFVEFKTDIPGTLTGEHTTYTANLSGLFLRILQSMKKQGRVLKLTKSKENILRVV